MYIKKYAIVCMFMQAVYGAELYNNDITNEKQNLPSFYELLKDNILNKNSHICIELTPHSETIPAEFHQKHPWNQEKRIAAFLFSFIELTVAYTACYKIPYPCYLQYEQLLSEVMHYIKTNHPKIPVIVDCQISGKECEMDAYVRYFFGKSMHADAVTINPYIGGNVGQLLSEAYKHKAAFVVVKTNNKEREPIQNMHLSTGELVWQRIIRLVVGTWDVHANFGVILSPSIGLAGAKELRRVIPYDMPILISEIEMHSNDLSVVASLFNCRISKQEVVPILVNVLLRDFLYTTYRSEKWKEKMTAAVLLRANQLQALKLEQKASL